MTRSIVAITTALALSLVGVGSAGAQEADGESTQVEAGEALGDEQVVLSDGHVDVGPRFVDDEWTLLVRDDTTDPPVWRRLSDVVMQVPDTAEVTVPDDPAFGFLGEPGAPVWLLPQVQELGIVWPGWNTQDPEVATTIDGPAVWSLTGAEGPGAFVLFVNGEFGEPTVLFDSREAMPQETSIEPNTHAHGNWTFTIPGVYRLDLTMVATTTDGDEVTGSATLQLAVGDDTDPQTAFGEEEADPEAGATAEGEAEDEGASTVEDDNAAAPAQDEDDARSDDSSSTPLVLAAVGIVLLALGAAAVVMRSRSRRPGPGTTDKETTTSTSASTDGDPS